jgi:hypothetical protein
MAARKQPASPRRLARRLGLDGNPLRRATDRAEAWIRIGLLAVFLIAGPMVTVATARSAAHRQVTETSAQAADEPGLRADQAVLVRPATNSAGRFGAARGGQVWVRARLERGSAAGRTVEVPARVGSPAGSVVTVWVDASGRVADPEASVNSADPVILTAVVTPLILGLALGVAASVARLCLNRRRLAGWEAAWSAVEPRWTGRR